MSYFIQFLMGALFEVAVFVFIVQSTTILDVFLNFAALEFITSVDEFAFKLAQRGYVSNAVKQACDEVRETKILRRKGGRICRRIQIIFFGLLMVGSYALMANWQDRGTYDCEKIEVQFGDGFSESSFLHFYTKAFFVPHLCFCSHNLASVLRSLHL